MQVNDSRWVQGHVRAVVACVACALSCGCSERVTVAESGAGGVSADSGGGGRVGPGGTGGTGSADGSGGSPPVVVNDPCDAVGNVDLSPTPFGGGAQVKGYVVAFDPPRVLGVRSLTKDAFGNWKGSVDHLDLEGSPSCEALRGALVFAIAESEEGELELVRSDVNASVAWTSTCDLVSITVNPAAGTVDRVRAFGMVVGSGGDGGADPAVDGPVPLRFMNTLPSPFWTVVPAAEDWPRCGPGYLILTVAHRGDYLVASHLELMR